MFTYLRNLEGFDIFLSFVITIIQKSAACAYDVGGYM